MKTKKHIAYVTIGLVLATTLVLSYVFLAVPNIDNRRIDNRRIDANCLRMTDYSDTGLNAEVDAARAKENGEEYERCLEARKVEKEKSRK